MGSRLTRLSRNTTQPEQPSQRNGQTAKLEPLPPQQAPVTDAKPITKQRTSPRVATLRKQVRDKLLSTSDEFDQMSATNPEHQQIVRDRLKIVLERARVQLNAQELAELENALIFDLLGYGAIEPLVQNRNISEIMVNGPESIFAEHKGKLVETEYTFDDDEHIIWTAERIVRPLQRDLSRRNPMVDARLPDGSRVHIIIPPAALNGPTLTIRKFPESRLTVDQLVEWGSFTSETAEFLQACVVARLNVVVSGGTGSGKTTLLNVLSSFIPEDERIVTIEDSAELQLDQRHVVRLETCSPVSGSKEGQLAIRDLVKGSLRMRPDRIVVGECRSGEALDMLQAMNTGHDGSLTTVHANSPRDAIARLETLALMAGMDLPVEVIRRQIASAVNLIVQQARLKDGSRKIIQITELQGMEGDRVTLQDIFVYQTPDHRGSGPSHAGGGTLNATGFRPSFMEALEQAGFKLSGRIFGAGKAFN